MMAMSLIVQEYTGSEPASESRHAVSLIVREYEPDSVRLDRQRA